MSLKQSPVESQQNGGDTSKWDDWGSEYYDVTTEQVVNRLQLAIAVDGSFLEGILGTTNKPDFYGPFWIAVCSAISIFASGSIYRWLKSGSPSLLDYSQLTSALTTILSYVWLEGIGVWAVCKYAYSCAHLELAPGIMVTLNGYSLALLPPASLLMTLPWLFLRAAVMGTAAIMSCLFIYRNAYHVMGRQEGMRQEQVGVLMSVWLLCHASLFALITIRYF